MSLPTDTASVTGHPLIEAIGTRLAAHPAGRVSSRRHTGTKSSATTTALWSRSDQIAGAISARPDRQIVLLLDDIVDFVPAFWGCLRAGRTAVPMSGAARAAMAGRRQSWDALARLDAPLLLADDTFMDVATSVPGVDVLRLADAGAADTQADVKPTNHACLIQTSGSTGVARFAALSPSAILARSFRRPKTPDTVVCGFGFDTVTLLRPITLGCGHWVQVPPTSAFGHPVSMLDAVQHERATGMIMSTGLARLILDHADDQTWDLSSLQWVSWGLERLNTDTAHALGALLTRNGAAGLRFRRGYGTTETGLISSAEDDWTMPLDDVGRVVDTKDARIVDGVIQVKDYPGMFSGYVGEPEGTVDGFTPDGWWSTGDRGDIVDGVVTITGRAKDIVITRGAKHSLAEIEQDASAALDGVEVFACAIDDPASGVERLGLAVVSDAPATAAVSTFVADRFGLSADPVVQLGRHEIPRASNGKVQRGALADRLRSTDTAGPAILLGEPLTGEPTAPTMAAALAQRFGHDPEQRLITYSLSGEIRSRTRAELWERSARMAGGLREAGVQPGTPVVLTLGDTFHFVTALWAGVRAGCTIVPLGGAANAMRGTELTGLLGQLDEPVVLVDERFADLPSGARLLRVDDLDGDWDADLPAADPVFLLQTSGTTGKPKLAMVSESALLRRHFMVADRPPENAVVVSVFTGMRATGTDAGTFVDVPAAMVAASPLTVLDAIEHFGATLLMIHNSFARRIVAAAEHSSRSWDLSSLKAVNLGAETIVPEAMRQFDALLTRNGAHAVDFRAFWGTQELGRHVRGADPRQCSTDTASLGAPGPGIDFRIVSAERRVLREGEIGEVELRSPACMFTRYLGAAETEPDRWWPSGDRAVIENGAVRLLGRMGEDLGPGRPSLSEIDARLQAVLDPAVSAYSCRTGDSVTVVVLADGQSGDIETAVRDAIEQRFGLRVDVVRASSTRDIPFLQASKVRRVELAERVLSGRFEPEPTRARESAAPTTAAIWREVLGVSGPLLPGATFASLGGDSLRAAQLFAWIETETGVRVPVAAFFAEPTLANLERLVATGSTVEVGQARDETRGEELIRKQLVHVSNWPGARPTDDPLVTALNLTGTKVPIAWVFQGAAEFEALASALGPDQPLYGMRSGHMLMRYHEDDIQVFALRYARAIDSAVRSGPIVMGGNCQGGVIALAAAQHLVRRGREVPLLALLDWITPPQPYAGSMLIVHGKDEAHRIGYLDGRGKPRTDLSLSRRTAVESIPAAHGHYFEPDNVERLARILTSHIRGAQTMRRKLAQMIRQRSR